MRERRWSHWSVHGSVGDHGMLPWVWVVFGGGGDNGETSVNIGQLDRVGRTTRGEGVVQGFEG